MAGKITMDVKQLGEALAILKNIPHDLHNAIGAGKPVDSLSQVRNLPDDLKGFGVNGGTASSFIANCVNDLYLYIQQLVQDLETQSGIIGDLMDNSIKAYVKGDGDSSTVVNNSAPSSPTANKMGS